ncbi:hypothetical protein GCM10009720_14890 [Yaniella flava]|uniref:VOC domain-containing protein n=1 Tax=Yaniella flava TaxID=287930 RepID=A0ABN2UEN9_9MICC
MTAPNLFLIYVQDAQAVTAFYSDLFDLQPIFTSPRYVAFEVAPDVLFALWTGRNEHAVPTTPRMSEVGLMIPGTPAVIDEVYERWVKKNVTVIEEPYMMSSVVHSKSLTLTAT